MTSTPCASSKSSRPQAGENVLTILRVAASFAIVGILLWIFMRASNGKLGKLVSGTSKGRSGDPLSILDRRQLTRSAGIALIRAGDRHLLVGVSDQGVQLLAEGDDLATAEDTAAIGAPGSEAIVVPTDVVSHTALPIAGVPISALSNTEMKTDQPDAWTRSGTAQGPRSPRMSFVAALREMTVRS